LQSQFPDPTTTTFPESHLMFLHEAATLWLLGFV
jgi:hypothetical protein